MARSAQNKPDEGKRTSLAQEAYEVLKRRIITTEYAPGVALKEAQISADLGFGRNPVHHALHRLSREALVEIRPRKGVIVRPVSLDEIAQIIEARLLTEPHCAARAASLVSQAGLQEPTRILAEAEREVDGERRIEKLIHYDNAFHSWILKTAGNQVLEEVLGQLQDRSARSWFLSLSDDGHAQRVQEQHKQILRAIGARDSDGAADAARLHIESFRDTILKVI
ncbi:GntR family transcriptional regulator [Marinibacterium profundimaris]|uniref:HTH gntR-type domain-containing protein n=1 Tax=Marinibacterium profundimaris TaxID=1679460 RepID=A0A225NFF6_9RHOB|nr:GntR family transcriptional regulator [Marinibacterium profundimaris]OWU68337.1 hypothetical protein ATO3_24460 [Marinibacterium profundimaris]